MKTRKIDFLSEVDFLFWATEFDWDSPQLTPEQWIEVLTEEPEKP